MPHSVYYDEDGGRFRTEILDPRLAREDVALWIGSASVVRRCADWGLVSAPASDAFSEPKIMRSIRDNLLATGAAKSMAVGLIRDDWK